MAAFNSPSIPLPSAVVIPNNETVGGTLAVSGATTLASTLAVTGAATLSSTVTTGALTVTGNETVSGTLAVTGATNLTAAVITGSGSGQILSVKGDTNNFYAVTNPSTSATARQITIGESSNNSGYTLALGYFSDGTYKGAIQATSGGTGTPLAINAAGGNVGIGTATPSYVLHVNTDSAGKPGAGGLWTVVSDERIKTDIVPADLDRCYEIVKSVPLKHFGFKPGVYTDEQIQDKHSLGWIAQDVQAVFEKAVSVKPFTMHTPQPDGTVQDDVIEDCLDLNSGQMIAALYGCVQALMAKVEALEARG